MQLRLSSGSDKRIDRRGWVDRVVTSIVVSLILSGCSDPVASEAQQPRLSPGDHSFVVDVDGRQRHFLVRVPPTHSDGQTTATLIAYHGGGGTAAGFKADAGLDAVADREGFVVVYPGGVGRTDAGGAWNAGLECCGYAGEVGINDVLFFERMVEDLARKHPVDLDHIWVTGHSNGAKMAYRIAAERSEQIAGAVGVAGVMQMPSVTPQNAVPVLHIHSEDDPRAFYLGGDQEGGETHHAAVPDMLQAWRQVNGCTGQPTEVERRNETGRDAHSGSLLVWSCSSAPLRHWRLSGPGHPWPGAFVPRLRQLVVGPTTEVVLAAEEVWTFMKEMGS